jgi:hypothetical protein
LVIQVSYLASYHNAGGFLTNLRIQNQSTIISSESDDADFIKNDTPKARVDAQNKMISKWALQWKTIIRSSLGNTAYPYCLYIRSLDLRNLAELLEDPVFRDHALDSFFADDMARFLKAQATPMKKKVRGAKPSYQRLDIPVVLDLVGESITRFVSESASQNRTTASLEDLSGNISATALPRWVGRLSRLKGMTLWNGAALNENVASQIAKNCPDFDDLTFYTCLEPDVDQQLASFFSGLNRGTLRSFAALGANAVGPETLLSLNHHAQSLKRLELGGLKSEAIKNLSFLQGCTALETLGIQDADGVIDLEATQNDVFLEIIAWLSKCNVLRELLFRNLISSPAILTQVCLQNNIRLRKLQVVGYPLLGNQDFHKALSHQTSLESLELRGDAEGVFGDDLDALVSSISQLTKLKYLDLLSTSDYFRTSHIMTLTSHLRDLEELQFSGYEATDDLWRALANLHHLRALNIHALSSFSYDGILTYISTLNPDTNQGLTLSIMNQNSESGLDERQETIIRKTIATKVDGKFDFTFFREPDSTDESFSD